MPIAAVPNYLDKDFKDASPGMRFGMYLALWEMGWSKSKDKPLDSAKKLGDNDQKTLKALGRRQLSGFNAAVSDDNGLRLEALSTAPFTTGLGNAHPLENGFAFLNPYGLPYLPGSGVKGVLRQAARELAGLAIHAQWDIPSDWNEDAVTALFGKQPKDDDTDHLRGALTFWDVIPQIKGESLAVDIMTPHQSHYYQHKQEPKAGNSTTAHDSGQPNPITFLTVPPGSGFTFHVTCDLAHLTRLAPDLAADGSWKTLLTAAFKHAFLWLGFGAKTAVGYGAMREDQKAGAREAARQQAQAEATRRAQKEAEREAALAQMSPLDREIREFLDARQDKNQPDLSALIGGLKKGRWSGVNKIAVAERAKAMMLSAKKWREKSEKKNPDKDNDYQDTLKVMAWIKGQ
ncbi:type III-B CRISPR module RAMP protein Cmr6 [Zoogloea sp.]|uniref:type III-B CRISPR module RAMP protein Cmr6 n=1 Tax=Zoogloea sp. TaxID=49181 RepID=UPI0035B332A0